MPFPKGKFCYNFVGNAWTCTKSQRTQRQHFYYATLTINGEYNLPNIAQNSNNRLLVYSRIFVAPFIEALSLIETSGCP